MVSVDYKAVRQAANQAIEEFAGNRVFSALDAGKWSVTDYQHLLLTLFYQIYQGSMSFDRPMFRVILVMRGTSMIDL
ncbi:hypothetical protein PPH41_45320 [Burkholderia gladioli]|nr:hypothetical protein [Burkholderia gladioli]